MKSGYNYWIIICLVMAFITLGLLGVSVAQDQNPPEGKEKGVWVLVEKKPEGEADEDWANGAYYNNHLELNGSTINGGYSWKDGDDPKDCRGKVWGAVSWNELPRALTPGDKQETTIASRAMGDQSCSARHPGACAHMEINGVSLEPHPCVGFSSGDKNQDAETARVFWEAPWGNIGENLTICIMTKVPGSVYANVYYTYSYQEEIAWASSYPFEKEVPYVWAFEKSETTQKSGGEPSEPFCDPIPPPKDSGVKFSGVSGEVSIRPDCNPLAWRGAGLKSIISIYDHIRTEEDSSAILSFADMTTFVMKPETEIIIDTPPEKDSKVDLVMGKVWTNFKKMMKDGTMEVQMSQAVSGIKGTIIVCEDTGDSSTLKVLDGIASLRSKTTGEEILVNAGEMATANASGLSQTTPFDIQNENTSWKIYINRVEPYPSPASTQDWDPRGDWRFNYHYGGKTYVHDMIIDFFDQTTGVFKGHGQESNDLDHIWDVTGAIEGDKTKFYIDYKGKDPDYWVDADGVISSDAYISGSAEAPGQTATWDATRSVTVSGQSIMEPVDNGQAKVDQHPVPAVINRTASDEIMGRTCSWTGTWQSNFGQMELQQSGNIITGIYTHDQGRIHGTISGEKFIGRWSEAPSYHPPNDSGDFEFIMSNDCRSFSGNWRYGSTGDRSEGWSGTRQ
jgi:hypothetical protein